MTLGFLGGELEAPSPELVEALIFAVVQVAV